MNAPDIFALGGRQDAELVALENELTAVKASFDKHPMPDDEAGALAHRWRDLERRINEAAPRTASVPL